MSHRKHAAQREVLQNVHRQHQHCATLTQTQQQG